MIPDFSGDYVSAKSIKDGDILEILDEGKVERNETLKKDMFNIKVSINGKNKVWSPSNKHGNILQKAFGIDTKDWIGKKVQLLLVEDNLLIKPLV